MFGLLRKRQRSIIGAEIDSLSASLLELTREGNGFCIKAYKRGALPQKDTVTDEQTSNDVQDIEEQGTSLAKLLKKANFSSREVISAVSASNVITKRLVMDALLSDEEMESQITLEAEQVIPYPIDEVALDFEIIGENANDEEKVDVLLVACRKQTVDDKESVLSLAGLQPQAIDVVSYAMERAYPLIQSQLSLPSSTHSTALVHISDLFITLNVLKDGQSLYVRSCPFGVRQLADLICQKTKCTLQEALEHCIQQTLPKSEDDFIDDFFEQTARQINRLLEQYYSVEHAALVDHIVLSGGLPVMKSLQNKMTELTNVNCSLANPFSDMKIESSLDKEHLSKCAPAYFIACGLAMRGHA